MDSKLERMEALFQEAADLPTHERAAFLDRECGSEPLLRERVWAMLAELDGDSLLPPILDEAPLTEGPGTIIGRYKLLQKIGEGGFGVVYMAEQQEPIVRRVALKIIKLGMDTKEVVARFEAERQALALMDHPNIARVLDGGATDSGRPYFVMELVRGVSITQYCDESSLSTQDRLQLFVPVCHAVQHAHQKGVIHRDIKPSNVMVTLHDGHPVPKVIDFGVAKAMHTRLTEKTLFTAYERFIGTPAYMSPEQAELSGLDVDTRTDIYSLGVLLYELLTGSTPFDTRKLLEEGLAAIQRTIREEPPQRPSMRISTSGDAALAQRRQADVPSLSKLVRGDLDWIVMKCLEKERVRRYETTSELAADIERHLRDEPVSAGPPSAAYRMRKLLARNRAAVASAAVILLGLTVGLIGLTLGLLEADDERREALFARERAVIEAERAQAVTDFMIETLALTSPDVALDANLSVATLLHRASEQAGDVFDQEPEAEARIRATIGRAYRALGENRLAEQNLRRGIELMEQIEDVDPTQQYDAMWDLTHVLFALEKPDAMAVAQDARRVAHDYVRQFHPEMVAVLDRFVEVTNDAAFTHDPKAAKELPEVFAETVRVTDATLSPGDPLWPIVADTWISSAYSVWYGPLDPMTIDFWGRALEIQERELAPNDPQIGETTGLYVSALTRNGRAGEAEAAMRASVERLREVLPPESPQLAFAEGMLGDNLASQGRFQEAEPLLLHSHQVVLKTIGEVQNFTVADSYARLLGMYDAWGNEAKAAPIRGELATFTSTAPILMPWPILRLVFGPDHAELVADLDELAELFGYVPYTSITGDVDDPRIEPLVSRVMETRRATLPNQHSLSIIIERQLLFWANSLAPGRNDQTKRAIIEEALPILELHREKLPIALARGHALLSEVLRGQNDLAGAAKHGREAWSLLHDRKGDWLLAGLKLRVAGILVPQGLYPEAESLLLPAYELLLYQFGPEHTDAVRARELLYETYTAWGKPEEAVSFAAPALETIAPEEE